MEIFFQIENAVAQLKIKTRTVELAAIFQTAKGLLRHVRVEYFSFDLVDLLALRAPAGRGNKAKQCGAAARQHRVAE